MFENASHIHFKPGRFDLGLKTLREAIVPVLRKQPGLLTLALIPDPPSGRVTLLSVWQSQTCARAVEANCEFRREVRRLDAWTLAPLPRPVFFLPVQEHPGAFTN